MKNKKLFFAYISGTITGFIAIVLVSLLFKKLNLFDYGSRSFAGIVIDSFFTSIIMIFIFMTIYTNGKRKIKN